MQTGREYLRVSQDRTGQQRSTTEQHNENIRVASERGVQLGEPYRDDSVGASRYSRKRRDDFPRLLGEIDSGLFGADELWLWEPSRGSRKVGEWVTLIEVCEQQGIRIFVTSHRKLYDLANARDRRSLLEDAVDSEYESAKISERVNRAVRARAAAGRPHGRHLYGYRREYDPATGALGGVVKDEDAALVVAEAFARFAAGEGTVSIALDFTKRGIPTPGKSVVWRNPTIRNMVVNEGYRGHRVSKAGHAMIKDAWPAIVDEVTWFRCQARIADPSRAPRQDWTVKYLLSGIPDCGVEGCAGKMVYNRGVSPRRPGKAYPSYVCADRRHNSRAAGPLEALVVEFVLTMYDQEKRVGRADPDPQLTRLEAAHVELSTELRMWQDAPGTEGVTPASVAAAERRLIPKIEALERQLAAARASYSLPDLGGRTLRAAWPRLPLERKREIIAASVRIRVLKVGQGKRFDPESVVVRRRW